MSNDPVLPPPDGTSKSTDPASKPEPAGKPTPAAKPTPAKDNRGSKAAATSTPRNPPVTRAGMVWVAVIAGLVMLVLLIIFILQNEARVTVNFFSASGELSLGMALFIAAVGGGILVAIAGAVRILQLRNQRRHLAVQTPAQQGPSANDQPGHSATRRPGR